MSFSSACTIKRLPSSLRCASAWALASVWFTAYPTSVVTRDGESVLQALGDDKLWKALSAIGIQGVHSNFSGSSVTVPGTPDNVTVLVIQIDAP